MRVISMHIKRPERKCDIVVSPGLFRKWRLEIRRRVAAPGFLVVADRRVAELRSLHSDLAGEAAWRLVTLEGGEGNKTLEAYCRLCGRLLAEGIGRDSAVVALGGGVIGDIAGFAAATLLRGVRLVQIPTTLLAQVDSSVGGKAGVNAAGGKNLVGAFHQPELTLVDPDLLDTLPEREYLDGVAEMVKYGVIGDEDFYRGLYSDAARLAARDKGLLAEAIAHCCAMKADIVGGDETDRGRRALLNFGHTFGHVLESAAGYDGSVTHGEAVAVGMALAAGFAASKKILAESEMRDILFCLKRLRLPVRIGDLGRGAKNWRALLSRDALAASLLRDKKAEGSSLTLVLPRAVGDCRTFRDQSAEDVADFMLGSLDAP